MEGKNLGCNCKGDCGDNEKRRLYICNKMQTLRAQGIVYVCVCVCVVTEVEGEVRRWGCARASAPPTSWYRQIAPGRRRQPHVSHQPHSARTCPPWERSSGFFEKLQRRCEPDHATTDGMYGVARYLWLLAAVSTWSVDASEFPERECCDLEFPAPTTPDTISASTTLPG